MVGYSAIPLVLTSIIMVPLLIAVFVIVRLRTKKSREDAKTMRMLQNALASSVDREDQKVAPEQTKVNPIKRMATKFDEAMRGAEFINQDTTAQSFYKVLAVVNLAIMALVLVFTQAIVFSLIIPLLLDGIIYLRAAGKVNKISKLLNEQVPSFISTLKSNVQANQTPEKAIIAAVDNTSEPLYSEIKIVKQLAETGSFNDAMQALRNKTTNETLKFLCSCVQLSAEVGSNLEEQLEVIEEIIIARKELDRKLDSAVAENKPLLYVSFSIIPGVFIFTYMINEASREFWFHGLISWVCFGIVIIVMMGAAYLANKFITKVKKM